MGAGLDQAELADVEVNKVRRAYNAAQYIEHRTRMMLWWSGHLDAQKGISELLG